MEDSCTSMLENDVTLGSSGKGLTTTQTNHSPKSNQPHGQTASTVARAPTGRSAPQAISSAVAQPSQLRPILPAPAPTPSSLVVNPPMAAVSLPYISDPRPVVPLYTQNSLHLLLAKLNGGLPTSTEQFAAPIIFQGRKQRSGKWITEEEEYADVLIQLFEKGYLFDCENGSTLRSYLSRKLHCAPMRISKKYAGKGIGKMLFICRIRLNMSVLAPCLEHIKALQRQANEKELLFYKAIFTDKLSPDPRDAVTGTSSNIWPNASMPVGSFPSLNGGTGGLALPVSHGPLAPPSTSGCSQKCDQASAPSNENLSANGRMPSCAGVDGFTVALQQSFYKALQQLAGPESFKFSNPSQLLPPYQHDIGKPQEQSSLSVAVSLDNSAPQIQKTSVLRPDEPTKALALSPIWVSSGCSLRKSMNDEANDLVASALSPVPDFVAGFEQVKLMMRDDKSMSMHNIAEEDLQEYSPPFTSRSFDDFHRFLGEDFTHLGSPILKASQPAFSASSPLHPCDPAGTFSIGQTAESGQLPGSLWPCVRATQIDQLAPVSSHAQLIECGKECSSRQFGQRFQPFMTEPSVSIISNEQKIPRSNYNFLNKCYEGTTVSENNDSGRSVGEKSGSEQDNVCYESSEDSDWEDNRVSRKRKVEGSVSDTVSAPARSKSKIHAVG